MKRKISHKLISFVLIVLFLFASGCKETSETPPNHEQQPIATTDIYLANNNASDYMVVIPELATEWEEFAANEFVLFFKQATGIQLPIVSDSGRSFSENESLISIGNTTIFQGSGVTAPYNELGRDGYKIVRKGKTVVLIGGGGYGNIYAVYGFLRHEVDFRAYAPDELYVKKVKELKLLDFNLTDVPDFANRGGGYYVTYYDRIFSTRSRTFAGYDTRLFQESGIWGSWAHNHLNYLPFSEYGKEHPDWYGANNTQLCLSNMEMRAEMKKKVKEKILKTPDSELYMLGQMDISTFCNCENCAKITAKYQNSGLMMQFINDIAKDIAEWQAETCPERDITICTFAYQQTQAPPVVQNSDGSYSPIDETVVALDNVCVEIAPISADYLAPINDIVRNADSKRMLEGWSVCADKLMIWSYCNNFSQTLEYFDNISTIATNYKAFRDIGATFLYDESSGSAKQAFAFQTMMAYIHSELMWDCELNVDDLVDDFMRHYYKEAYAPMRAYYDIITNFVSQRKLEFGKRDNTYYGTAIFNDRESEQKTLLSSEFWSKQILMQMLGCFESAYDIVEKSYTGELKERMMLRLTTESLTPRMYLLNLFFDEIDGQEYLNLVDEFEKDAMQVGVPYVFLANESLANDMNVWRNKVSK